MSILFSVKWRLHIYRKQLPNQNDCYINHNKLTIKFKILSWQQRFTIKVRWCENNVIVHIVLLGNTAFCWAFSISSMITHSLNYFIGELTKERPLRFDDDKLDRAIQYLNCSSNNFHKRLRIGLKINSRVTEKLW